MSRRTAKRQTFYSDQRRMRVDPCYLGHGESDHDWQYISDWCGDPEVVNGTADCSYVECRRCGMPHPDADQFDPGYHLDY